MKHKEKISFFMEKILKMNASAKSNKIYKSYNGILYKVIEVSNLNELHQILELKKKRKIEWSFVEQECDFSP